MTTTTPTSALRRIGRPPRRRVAASTQITIRLTPDEYASLIALAAVYNRPLADVARDLLLEEAADITGQV